MKYTYYDATVCKFMRKHSTNFNQLFHMVWSSHMSLTNLVTTTFFYNPEYLPDVITSYRLNAIDIGTSVDNFLHCKKKRYKLPEKYKTEFGRLLQDLRNKDLSIAQKIEEISKERGLTWGLLITLIIQEHISIAIDIAIALSEGKRIDDMLNLIRLNGVNLINVYQTAGNNPIMVNKGIKIWNEHNEQFVKQIKARINKDNIEAIKLHNALQLHSFPMSNFFYKAIN